MKAVRAGDLLIGQLGLKVAASEIGVRWKTFLGHPRREQVLIERAAGLNGRLSRRHFPLRRFSRSSVYPSNSDIRGAYIRGGRRDVP